MAFFVMMFSISEPSQEKYEAGAGGIVAAIGGKDAAQAKPFSTMLRQMEHTTTTMEISEKTEVKSTQKGVTFDFKSQGMFKPGSAELLPESVPVLDRVAQLITFMGITNYSVDVEGHTDDIPISTAQYPSNWELLAQRATNIVRFLASRGVKEDRLRAIGHASTRSKVPHRNAAGQPILENQSINPRVVIRIER
jgi:chemotaxis protein MotB